VLPGSTHVLLSRSLNASDAFALPVAAKVKPRGGRLLNGERLRDCWKQNRCGGMQYVARGPHLLVTGHLYTLPWVK
jgi:hypothetical protein